VHLLGYGLCSQAAVRLGGNYCTLVVPKADDCIAIMEGSEGPMRHSSAPKPGTYCLTKGWIEAGDGPFDEYDSLVERYGEEKVPTTHCTTNRSPTPTP
jgi:hypothetical protein